MAFTMFEIKTAIADLRDFRRMVTPALYGNKKISETVNNIRIRRAKRRMKKLRSS